MKGKLYLEYRLATRYDTIQVILLFPYLTLNSLLNSTSFLFFSKTSFILLPVFIQFIVAHSIFSFPFVSPNLEGIEVIHTYLIVAEETMIENTELGVKEYGDGVAWIRGSMIGKGSYGRVYLATLKNPASKYSCLPPLFAVKSAEVSVSSSIQKEKEVLTNLKGCPNIIECYGEETTVGDKGVMTYNLLLEYGSGGTLADRIKKSGGAGLPELEAKVFARSILRGLKHIHGLGYVHCDLKPDNILLVKNIGRKGDGGFRAKIGDFGLTKRGSDSKKRKLKPYWEGTPMYLSPEAVIDNVQEKPCDVWAVGCIVLEMLTGKALLDGDAEGILRKIGAGREWVKIPSELSKEARGFLKGCFVKNPMFRLTAEMLLCHKFLEDLDNDDAVEEPVRFAVNDIGSIALVSDELSCGSSMDEWSDGDEDGSFSSCSGEDDEEVSSPAEEKNNFDQSTETSAQSLLKRRKHDPVRFGIHVGM